jgi:hypothetical protein
LSPLKIQSFELFSFSPFSLKGDGRILTTELIVVEATLVGFSQYITKDNGGILTFKVVITKATLIRTTNIPDKTKINIFFFLAIANNIYK